MRHDDDPDSSGAAYDDGYNAGFVSPDGATDSPGDMPLTGSAEQYRRGWVQGQYDRQHGQQRAEV